MFPRPNATSDPNAPSDPNEWPNEPWSALTYRGFSQTSPRRAPVAEAYRIAPPGRAAPRGWKLAAASVVAIGFGVALGVWAYPALTSRSAPPPASTRIETAGPDLAAAPPSPAPSIAPPPAASSAPEPAAPEPVAKEAAAPEPAIARHASSRPVVRASTAERRPSHDHAAAPRRVAERSPAPRPRALAAASRAREAAEIAPSPEPPSGAWASDESTLDEQMAALAKSRGSRTDRAERPHAYPGRGYDREAEPYPDERDPW